MSLYVVEKVFEHCGHRQTSIHKNKPLTERQYIKGHCRHCRGKRVKSNESAASTRRTRPATTSAHSRCGSIRPREHATITYP